YLPDIIHESSVHRKRQRPFTGPCFFAIGPCRKCRTAAPDSGQRGIVGPRIAHQARGQENLEQREGGQPHRRRGGWEQPEGDRVASVVRCPPIEGCAASLVR